MREGSRQVAKNAKIRAKRKRLGCVNGTSDEGVAEVAMLVFEMRSNDPNRERLNRKIKRSGSPDQEATFLNF
jgi:hypothetical protein